MYVFQHILRHTGKKALPGTNTTFLLCEEPLPPFIRDVRTPHTIATLIVGNT